MSQVYTDSWQVFNPSLLGLVKARHMVICFDIMMNKLDQDITEEQRVSHTCNIETFDEVKHVET